MDASPAPLRSYFCLDAGGPPSLQPAARHASREPAARGVVTADSDGRRVYYADGEGDVVRRTVGVDGFCRVSGHDVAGVFEQAVEPLIDHAILRDHSDAIVFVTGMSGCSLKPRLLRGGVPVVAKPPDGARRGVVQRTVEKLLGESVVLHATLVQANLDHLSDALVFRSSTKDEEKETWVDVKAPPPDDESLRALLTRLVEVSQGNSIDMDDRPDGRVVVSERLELPIRSVEDILHLLNCWLVVRRTTKHGCAGFVLTLRIAHVSSEVDQDDAPVSTLHMVELPDADWCGLDADTATFRRELDTVRSVITSVRGGHFEIAAATARQAVMAKLIFGTVDVSRCQLLALAAADASRALDAFDLLSALNGGRVLVSLQGPDGGGSDSVDPELRDYVLSMQDECFAIESAIAALDTERRQLLLQVAKDEEAISELKEQRTFTRAPRGEIAARVASSDSRPAHESPQLPHRSRATPTLPTERRSAPRERALNPQQLFREQVASLDKAAGHALTNLHRQEGALDARLRQLQRETHHTVSRGDSLEKDLSAVHKSLRALRAATTTDRQTRLEEHHRRTDALRNEERLLLNEANEIRRGVRRHENDEGLRRAHAASKVEHAQAEAALVASEAAKGAAMAAKANHSVRIDELQRELEAALAAAGELRSRAASAQQRTAEEVRVLQDALVPLSRYAAAASSVLWRFEHHGSPEAREVAGLSKCGVPLFDASLVHEARHLEALVRRTRAWLEQQGELTPPLLYHDTASGKFTFFASV